jgi:two-component system phosphate regulon sensor histidine kinase PhoR
MSNAIKYTPQRGIIAINIYKRSGIVTVAVKDNGMGIAKKDIPKVFQRFNRLNSAVASHVPGTGLGLYLTKKIIELHGGTVSVESNREQGSTFIIKLPVGKDSGKNTHS